MNRLAAIVRLFVLALVGASSLHAQWKTEEYVLKEGYNGIYLHGDASHATPTELFAAYPAVTEVWRWNPNPDQIQFSTSAAVPDATSSEWTIWKRNDPTEQQLTKMIGQSAYLIYWDGSVAPETTVPVRIAQKPMPPAATWLITGANFLGFPADPDSSTPTFANYFASFPVAITTPAKIYKYIGGELGALNPVAVTSFGNEKVDRKTAYWFQAATVGNFTGLVEYELPSTTGLDFGRTAVSLTVGVMNRSNAAVTLTISTQDSEDAPDGQPGVTGSVPITRRVLDSTTGAYTETPIVGSFSVSVPANGRLDLQFGIVRDQLRDPISGDPASASSLFASLLRIKDSAQLTDVFLPVTAQPATTDGLWIGQVNVSSVVSTVEGSPGSTVARPFPLRVIMHVGADSEDVAATRATRLLSQAFVGQLASTGHADGVCTKESLLWADTKASALRLVSSQMPLDRVIAGTGTIALPTIDQPATLTFTVALPFDDPTNPFVHVYHPDHDNRDARFNALPAGVESYTITRVLTFNFTDTPPDGSTVTGWGTTVYGGTYSETITGLNRQPLTVGGTFALRRVSEVSVLTTE